MSSCNTSENSESTTTSTFSKEDLKKQINDKEAVLRSSTTIDNTAALSLISLYADFAKNYPDDKDIPDYLFKAGEISSAIKQSNQAINFFKEVCAKFPEDKKAKHALFLQGFVYETQLKDYAKAKEAYEQVIAKYPNDKMADDAKASIQYLGKSDEELIREFEKKNKEKK